MVRFEFTNPGSCDGHKRIRTIVAQNAALMPAISAQMPVVHAFKSNMAAQVSPCPAQNFACPAYMYPGSTQGPAHRA